MSDRERFKQESMNGTKAPEACAPWAWLLVDAAEGLLSETEQSVLDRHVSTCAGCAHELADAQRGAAWLDLLKEHAPEPPAALLNNILAKTLGSASLPLPSAAGPWKPAAAGVSPQGGWSHTMRSAPAHGLSTVGQRLDRWFGVTGAYAPALQPRLAMTSAMAFFSICLTLNLLGVSVHNLRAAEALRPAGLQRTVADTGASLVRSFEGIRLVYRVESRVNEWRTASTTQGETPLDPSR